MTTFSWLIILQPGWLLSCAVPPPWSRFCLLAGSKASWLLSRAVRHHGPWIQAVPNHAAGTYSSYRGPYLLQYTLKKISCLKWIKIDNCISGTRQRPSEHFSYSFPNLLWRQRRNVLLRKSHKFLYFSPIPFIHGEYFSVTPVAFLLSSASTLLWSHGTTAICCHKAKSGDRWLSRSLKKKEEFRNISSDVEYRQSYWTGN